MHGCNGYNVSPFFNALLSYGSISFLDIAKRKQTSILKLDGECIRIPDPMKELFEFLKPTDPVLAKAAVHKYKVVRDFLDFQRSFVHSKINNCGMYWPKKFEELAFALSDHVEGMEYRVSIKPHLATKDFDGAIALGIDMVPKWWKKSH